jgi:hypothetical protein
MAKADRANSTSLSALSRPATGATYRALNNSDGSIDLRVLMTLAHRRARQERAEYQRLGHDQPWRQCLSEALKWMWEIAKNQRDAIVAARVPAMAADPAAALCRELELLPYREDYRAAQMRRGEIEAGLSQHANEIPA